MGNCIGQRNQKNFYLFLWCTFIWMLYALAFSIFSFVDNVKQNGFVFVQFYEEIHIFAIFVGLVGIFILAVVCRFQEQTIRILSVPAVLVSIVSFFWIATYKGVQNYYENPVIPLLGIVIYSICALVLMNYTNYNCYLACIGSTLKQENFKQKNSISQPKFKLSQGCTNYVKFLTFKPPKSEILNSS